MRYVALLAYIIGAYRKRNDKQTIDEENETR